MNAGNGMKVKGSSIMAVPAFVQARYPGRYREWIDALSPESSFIHTHIILATDLYPLYPAMVEPTEKVCDLFFNGDRRGAWESGRFSADYALNGIYKFLYRIGSPQFIIERASRVFSSYYPEGELKVTVSEANKVVLQIVKFPEPYRVLDYDMGGWMEGTLELLKCDRPRVEITKSMSAGDSVTEFVATWS